MLDEVLGAKRTLMGEKDTNRPLAGQQFRFSTLTYGNKKYAMSMENLQKESKAKIPECMTASCKECELKVAQLQRVIWMNYTLYISSSRGNILILSEKGKTFSYSTD